MRRTSDAAGIETMKYAAKNADCTSITSPYERVNRPLSLGMITSLRLVIPPKAKNSVYTKARRLVASVVAWASLAVAGAAEELTAASNAMCSQCLLWISLEG